ncbi:MAG: pyrroloquinoline quinone-dependent dehydrogenase [Proteobacteria bacterium]|nr:pyrroloquinoline quinone-dependent dehydrogenase [Pseudomonadota bacterium]
MKKKTLVVSVAVVLILLLPFLGGSAIWYLGGAHGLDVNGTAKRVGRPENSISVGDGWSSYGGDAGGHRYSDAAQITIENVDTLVPAWEYRTGDLVDKAAAMSRAATEGTPILVEDSLVFCTPFNEIIALDPGTGLERWRFDPEIDLDQRPANQFVCRGVSHWQDADSEADCSSRILMGTNDARLIAVDARTGQRCQSFGTDGQVRIDPGMALWWPGEFQITSPPAIIGDTVIVGSAISDNARVAAPKGSVRAFDARTGEPRWDFDPVPRGEGDPERSDWQGDGPPTEGHANVWAPMSVDPERGLVFLPTSSPSPDFYGGLRPGDNRYANSVVALNGTTGEVVWSFQTVHHDVWDYDVPAQPGLYTVWRNGKLHDVVAQVTKTGFVFVLDRDTGEAFLPIEERPVPQDGIQGEILSPTQPFPAITPPIVPNVVSADDAFGITWFDKHECRKLIENSRAQGLFTPPSTQGTILLPFTGGGANWGGAAYDPERNLLVVNMSNIAHHVQLFRSDNLEQMREVFHDQEVSPQEGAPYGMKRETLMSSLDLPCTQPPWGIIAGVNLDSGEVVWRKTIGTTEDLSFAPGMKLGTPTFGGPMITATGVVFIGATMDHYLRAFDVSNGEELWRGRLQSPAMATPMSYEWKGRQYVVIYAGGNARTGTKLSDRLVAFALP